jgi:hypothetical protein
VRFRLPQPSRAGFRVALRVFKIVALVALVYEVAFNAFLLTHCLSRVLNGNPDSLLVTYRTGWSIIPGYVHARGLRIRSKDNGIEFDLRIERCAFHFVPWELAQRRFHVTHVGGDGISFVSRLRIQPDAANARTLAEIPQIEGLERMPVKEPDNPPPDDANYKLWTVALDDVDAESVHEVWIHSFRYVGDARVVGGFFLRPTRWANVLPCRAFFRGGAVTTAGYIIASDVSGRIDAQVDPYDPRVTSGIQVFRKGGGLVRLDVGIPSVAFLRHWLSNPDASKNVDVRGGAGEAHSNVRIDHGRLAPGTRFSAALHDVEATHPKVSGRADVDVSAIDTRENGEPRFDTVVAATGVVLRLPGYEAAPVRAERAEIDVHDKGVDFVESPLGDAVVTARVPRAEVSDARAAQAFLGSGDGLRVEAGHGTIGGELGFERGVGRGRGLFAIDGVRLAQGETTASGNVRAEVDLHRWTLNSGLVDLAGSRVQVTSVRAPGGTDDWWANLQLASATVDPSASPTWHSQILAEARDIRPFVARFVEASSLPPWLVPLLTANDLRVRAALSAGREGIDLKDCIATAGPLRAQARLAKRGDATSGVAFVASGPLAVGIELRDGGTHVQLTDVEGWFQRKLAGE